jgi:pyrroline-5-carboxylate reductase
MSKFVFIGGGNMASCLIGGMLANGVDKSHIMVAEPNATARQQLADQHGVSTTGDNLSAAASAEVIVLAVKPQIMSAVATHLAPALNHNPVVISIAAGIPISALENWLGTNATLIRAMPNTPAMVQSGATGLYANRPLNSEEKKPIESIFDAVGFTCWVAEEKLIDAVTAVSGSGPAYFFLVYESMQKVGQELGLDAKVAAELTLHTALGAARLALSSDKTASELRQQVTSPGGTTQAAIECFQSGGIEDVFRKAMVSALERAEQMSAEFSK